MSVWFGTRSILFNSSGSGGAPAETRCPLGFGRDSIRLAPPALPRRTKRTKNPYVDRDLTGSTKLSFPVCRQKLPRSEQ